MPRPRLSADALRNRRITASVNRTEWYLILDRASEARMTVPEFIRQRVVWDRLQIQSPKRLDAETFREVQRIGNNINQIAKRMNQGIAAPQGTRNELARLRYLLTRLLPERAD